MSSELAAGQTLDRVDALKAAVEDIGARVGKLTSDYHARVARERRVCEGAVQEHGKELASAQAEMEAAFVQARTAAQEGYERRKIWIGKAYQSSKESGLGKVEEKIGGRKYELQKRMLQAEKSRDAGLASTNANHAEFHQKLAAEQGELAGLEHEAQRLFRGYGGFKRLFFQAYERPDAEFSSDENQLLGELRTGISKARNEVTTLHHLALFRVFRYFTVWLILALVEVLAVPVLQHLGIISLSAGGLNAAIAAGIGAFVAILALRYLGRRSAEPVAASLSRTLSRARRVHDHCQQVSEVHFQKALADLNEEFQTITQTADRELKQTLGQAGDLRVSCRMKSDERTVRVQARHERMHRVGLERLDRQYREKDRLLKQSAELRLKGLNEACENKLKAFTAEYETARAALETEWNSRLRPIYAELAATKSLAETLFPPWTASGWKEWTPPAQFSQAAQFAQLEVDVAALCEAMPKEKELVLPGPSQFSVPLCLAYPQEGSILFETGNSGNEQAISALNNIILRLLTTAPAGRLNFTVIDPVGLGQNFAGVMHIADYEEQIINSRIWTQATQIEEKLGDLNEHMEKVIQMYLRNEYATIAEYNEQAGVIAEKYYFLVIADFPANFTDVAAKRLLSIAASGARCGVYMLIHWDHRQPLPEGFMAEDLRKSCITLQSTGNQMAIAGRPQAGARLALDQPPVPEIATELVHRIGRLSRDSSRVEVPFDHVAPPAEEVWSEDTTSEVRVPIGRTGATKLQYLAIGKGTRQHGLIAGKTGSGKSTLFHVIITNLALWCSPEQVEFYLVDFKKGVEFKCYGTKRLPHARVVAIESDREFGLSVLQRVDDELRRRGDLFRQLGVQDIAGYKRAGGKEAIPRTLLLVDEFQEFFVEDDKVAQTASLLMDRIVRQGRAFGIHVLLGSQTLGGAYTVARTTLGQMVIRIALQCNEADAYLIMDDNNPAPRLLSRPGEGIYNDMAGAIEGNSPFQVVWLPEEVRDANLTNVRERADQHGDAYPGPIVFEGNAPADVQENALLRSVLATALKKTDAGRIWLGAPNSIKGPTEVAFRSQSGNNLLIVGQREEAVLAMLTVGLISLAGQYPLGTARFIVFDATAPDTAERQYLEKVVASIPHPIHLVRPGGLDAVMKELADEKKKRAEDVHAESAAPVFLFINGIQRFSRLRYEEDFSFSSGEGEADVKAGAVLNDLVCEGSRLGFHVIATADTYNNVSRYLSRKAVSEFEFRVLFQMSANDSASLIDNPKAGMLGLHRALLFNAQEGHLETFRPYALPSREWVEQAGKHLEGKLKAES